MLTYLWRRSRGAVGLTIGALLLAVACGDRADKGFFERAPGAGGGGATGSGASSGTAGTSVSGSGGASGSAGSAGATAGGSAGVGSGPGGSAGVGGGVGGGTGGAALGGAGGTTAGGFGEGGMGEGGAPDCSAHGGDAVGFDGHCYLFRAGERTWDEAKGDCEQHGAHLVTISSEGRTRDEFEAENRFVWELGGMVPVWLGATDGKGPLQPGDGTFFKWVTGEPMTFDAWSGGQPNNAQASCTENTSCSCERGACYEHCAFQWANESAEHTVPGWNDRLCEHRIAHVCEWDF